MSRWILAAAVPGFFVGSLALAEPIQVQSPVDKVFTPLGFDDNDDSEIILHGDFPNSCYKVGPATATVDVEARKISISAKAWYYSGAQCTQMLVPFIQPVKVGILPAGDYEISVVDRPAAETLPLNVAVASSRSADDFLYAPVSQVNLQKEESGSFQLSVEGEYPYMFIGCMKIVEVRAQVTPGHVLVVQPISEMFVNNADCRDQADSKKFQISKPVTGLTESAEYLAHVRALSGQSVNRLFDLTR